MTILEEFHPRSCRGPCDLYSRSENYCGMLYLQVQDLETRRPCGPKEEQDGVDQRMEKKI